MSEERFILDKINTNVTLNEFINFLMDIGFRIEPFQDGARLYKDPRLYDDDTDILRMVIYHGEKLWIPDSGISEYLARC